MSKKSLVEGVSEERIRILFKLAEEFSSKDKDLSKKYIQLALKIAQRNRVKVPKELKTCYCKKCGCFLNEKNCSILREKNISILKCKECGFERKMRA